MQVRQGLAWVAGYGNGAELVKFTNNAVYRLAEAPVVVRIACERLAEGQSLSHDDRDHLHTACDDIEAQLARLRYVLPAGPIHGDATIGNLIPGPDGPITCDFDGRLVRARPDRERGGVDRVAAR